MHCKFFFGLVFVQWFQIGSGCRLELFFGNSGCVSWQHLYSILLVSQIIFSKPRHSKTAPPTEDRLADIEVTKTHLFSLVSYLSIELSEAEPSLPPKE